MYLRINFYPGSVVKYRRILLLFFLLLAVGEAVFPQVKLSGSVINEQQQPLAFANLILEKSGSDLYYSVTDSNGVFRFTINTSPQGKWQLRCTSAGYQSFSQSFEFPDTVFLRSIVLTEDQRVLREVTVNANRPLITRSVDRFVVDIGNSYLATGHSGIDLLQKLPGIWVSSTGSIRIKGSQPVMVMINDIVQRMSEDELAEYLRSLKSEDISRIEIIHHPPAEYEAAGGGGILHIILKKNRKDGWNGSVNAQYRLQGTRPYLSGGASLQYKIKQFYLNGSINASRDRRFITERAGIDYADKTSYSNETDRQEWLQGRQIRLGMGYDFSSAHSLNVQLLLTRTNFDQEFLSRELYSDVSAITKGTAFADKRRRFNLASTTFNYTWHIDTMGRQLKVLGDHTDNRKKENTDFADQLENGSLPELSRNQAPILTEINSLQADYTHPLKTYMLKGGVKYASIKRDNFLQTEDFELNNWVIDPGLSNQFIYEENLMMAYATIDRVFGNTSIKAGLRYELTDMDGNSITLNQRTKRQYGGLFPSVFIMQTIGKSKASSVYINYSRRLSRPGLADLNPAILAFNNYTVLVGNPNLLPQYTHNIGAGYKLGNILTADLYVTRTNQAIFLSANQGAGNTIEYRSENVTSTMQYGASINWSCSPAKGWQMNHDASVYHNNYRFNQQRYRQTSVNLRSVHTISLKKGFSMDAVAGFQSPYYYSNLKTFATFYMDAGIARKISGQGRIRLAFTDIFNSLREKELTIENGGRIEFYRKRPTRTVALSFTWNFSRGTKFSARKVDQSNTEERSRIGN